MNYDLKITRKNFIPVLLAPLWAVGIYFLYFHLMQVIPPYLQGCIFHRFTHLYCPGCGGTRAVHLLFTGHPLLSLRAHPVVLFTAVPVLYYYMKCLIVYIKNKNKPECRDGVWIRIRLHFLIASLILILVYFVARNILLVRFHIDLLKGL
ncbi:MAG: DUF2752 domain-containing protein [Lachnospiraceae bacterium]|nr:DUF2752 domain-containing protein [Lachnospiraceae bacterium]